MKKINVLLLVLMTVTVTGFLHGKKALPQETIKPSPGEQTEIHEATLFFAGDALLHGAVCFDALQKDGRFDFTHMVERLRSLTDEYDLVYYNQETILGGSDFGIFSYPLFNGPYEFGEAMIDTGFNLVSAANNHAMDMGEEGIARSNAFWKNQSGVVFTGTFDTAEEAEEIPVHEINGIRYSFLSWTYGINGINPPSGKEYLVNVYSGKEDRMVEQVRLAKKNADIVIVAVHWGKEYYSGVTKEQRELAEALAEAGADIIIGNHPHVIEPVEWIGNTICFYSMGNLISAQTETDRRTGMAGSLKIIKKTENGTSRVTINDVKADLVYTYYQPGFHHFEVIPFSQLDEEHLPGYQEVYEEYTQIITGLDSSVSTGFLSVK